MCHELPSYTREREFLFSKVEEVVTQTCFKNPKKLAVLPFWKISRMLTSVESFWIKLQILPQRLVKSTVDINVLAFQKVPRQMFILWLLLAKISIRIFWYFWRYSCCGILSVFYSKKERSVVKSILDKTAINSVYINKHARS